MNWGGPAFDPSRKWMIVNTTNVPQVVILVPREQIEGIVGINLEAGNDVAAALGTPYGVRREWLLSPLGAPCVKPPWGELLAVNMDKGNIEWRVPLGSIEKMLRAAHRMEPRHAESRRPDCHGRRSDFYRGHHGWLSAGSRYRVG